MEPTSKDSKRPQLHISAMNMLSFCGEQFRRRYIEKHIVPPGVALITGRGLDASVTSNLQNKIDTGELLPLEEVQTVAADTVRNEIKGGGLRLVDEEEVKRGLKAITGEAVDRAVRLSRAHAQELAPTLQPTAVQREFTLHLQGFPVDIAGTIDVDEADAIRDTKSARKMPSGNPAAESDQLTQYAFARKVLDGKIVSRVVLDYVIDYETEKKKEIKTKVAQFEDTRTDEDFRVLLRRTEVAVRAIEKGVFVPVKQSDPLCSPRWCGFFDSCGYVRKPVTLSLGGMPEDEKNR